MLGTAILQVARPDTLFDAQNAVPEAPADGMNPPFHSSYQRKDGFATEDEPHLLPSDQI
jgi:hypothetical protein